MYPDFLCIGAQKAGTMWLYHNLARHPKLRMPPVKEIHYFDRPTLPFIEPFWTNMGCIKGARRALADDLLAFRWLRDPRVVRWVLHFLFVARSDAWYRDLFDNADGRIAGDMTPAYSRLDGDAVARVHELLPQVKIIYILRNPIHRSWSQAVMHLRKLGATRASDLRDLPDGKVRACFERPDVVRNSAYSQTLEIWGSCFPASQIFICFFDDIVANPHQLLDDCFRFLGIDGGHSYRSPLADKRFNAASYGMVPERFHGYLAELCYPELCRLNERFGNRHTMAWLDECERSRRARPTDLPKKSPDRMVG